MIEIGGTAAMERSPPATFWTDFVSGFLANLLASALVVAVAYFLIDRALHLKDREQRRKDEQDARGGLLPLVAGSNPAGRIPQRRAVFRLNAGKSAVSGLRPLASAADRKRPFETLLAGYLQGRRVPNRIVRDTRPAPRGGVVSCSPARTPARDAPTPSSLPVEVASE